MHAIGPAAVSQAVKAFCVANSILVREGGTLLAFVPGLINKPVVDRTSGENVDWVAVVFYPHNIIQPDRF